MKPLALVALLLLLAAGLWWAWSTPAIDLGPPAGVVEAPGERPRAAEPAAPPRHPDATDATDGARSEAPGDAAPRPTEPAAPEPPPRELPAVGGRVLDLAGRPLAGVRLAAGAGELVEVATSAADGGFEFGWPSSLADLLPERQLEVEVAPGQIWTSALETPFTRERCRDLVVVAAPAIELGGRVEDAAGAPVESALVRLSVSAQDLREFPGKLDRCAPRRFEQDAGAAGSFRFEAVPAVPGTGLSAEAGDARGWLAAPGASALDLRLVVRPAEEGEPARIHGIVLDHAGAAAADARVSLGGAQTKTAADGTFELALRADSDDGQLLCAAKAGFQAAVVDVSERIASRDPSPLFVRLGPEALEIRGKVLLADGSPAARWSVQLRGGTEVSLRRAPPLVAEHFAATGKGDGGTTSTDSAGAFRLRGLFPKSYGVRAWDERSLLVLEAEGVAAGTEDLVLRVPEGATRAEVEGVVVDLRGRPVAGASVGLELVTARTTNGESWTSGKKVRTAADGAFRLTDVPLREVRLAVHGDELMETRTDVVDLDLARPLRLEVERRCHFRLVGAPPEEGARWLTVLDADGKELQIFTFQNGGWSSSSQQSIPAEGSTHALAVSERATTIVLHRTQAPERRLPLDLVPGTVTDVRY